MCSYPITPPNIWNLTKARLSEIVSSMKGFIPAYLLAPGVYRSSKPEILNPELFAHEIKTRG